MKVVSNIKAELNWTSRSLPDGRQVYNISLDQIPEGVDQTVITCEWSFPICDIAGKWHPNCRYDRTVKADWAHGEVSMSSVSAPVVVFFSEDGKNSGTFAVSEAQKIVRMNLGVHEEDGTMKCCVDIQVGQQMKIIMKYLF